MLKIRVMPTLLLKPPSLVKGKDGVFEVTLFPEVYRRCAGSLGVFGPYLVEGRVDSQYGSITITARDLRVAPLREGASPPRSSRSPRSTQSRPAVDGALRTG